MDARIKSGHDSRGCCGRGRTQSDVAYYVYILASSRNGTLYTGVTNDLVRRGYQHRTGTGSRFAKRYGVTLLVHFEAFQDVRQAIRREKAIKSWPRAWKVDLIEKDNPRWRDLYPEIAL